MRKSTPVLVSLMSGQCRVHELIPPLARLIGRVHVSMEAVRACLWGLFHSNCCIFSNFNTFDFTLRHRKNHIPGTIVPNVPLNSAHFRPLIALCAASGIPVLCSTSLRGLSLRLSTPGESHSPILHQSHHVQLVAFAEEAGDG